MFSKLFCEQLENRHALTSFSVPWPEPQALTLSFAADGTSIGKQSSALFQTLESTGTPAKRKTEILRAFQTWAVEANINIGLVVDGGHPFGTLGMKQADARFGDIRIGAFPMADDVVAVADPYDPFVANTWVGDIFLNSAERFSVGRQKADYDLYSVVLHEAGHALGIGHSSNQASPMYKDVHATNVIGLAPEDIVALRSLYGVRLTDAYEGANGNDTLRTATTIASVVNAAGVSQASVRGDLSTHDDVDIYRFVAPQQGASPELRLSAAGISLLTARVTILDAAGKVVTTVQTTDPTNNALRIATGTLVSGAAYYVRVEGARSDVFGIGAYELSIAAETGSAALPTIVLNNVAPSAGYAATAIQQATTLGTTPGYVEHTYYEQEGYLDGARASQTYRVRSADIDSAVHNVFSVLVTAPAGAGSRLQVLLFNDRGEVVDADVLYQAGGAIEVQAANVVSNRDYYVEISTDDALSDEQEFEVTADFDQDGAHLQTYVNDWLTTDQSSVLKTLAVAQSQQLHFVLSATDWNRPESSSVAMSIVDAAGSSVF